MSGADVGEAIEAAERGRRYVEARRNVVEQLEEILGSESTTPGGREEFSTRVRQILEAERRGDPDAIRSAVFDGAATLAAWAARLDLDLAA